jgi:cystathionine beta-lyase/cystathionine gamma-synthase
LFRKTKVVWLEILSNLVPFNIFLEKKYFLDFLNIFSRNFKFVVRFFAFCGQTIQNIDLVRKTKVVWLEILSNLVPFHILLEKKCFRLFSSIFLVT